VNIFKDIRGVFTGTIDGKKKKDEFLNLPPRAIIAWVKSSSLIIDSENSVFYFVMLWFLKEDKEKKYIGKIIKHIRFVHMKKQYLLDIIHSAYKYLDEEDSIYLRDGRNEALKFILFPKHPNNKILPGQRVLLPDIDKVMIKCVFQEVSKWDDSGKYYSSPVLINGYEFYFFLQRQLIKSNENPPVYGMAGFFKMLWKFNPSSTLFTHRLFSSHTNP